MAWAKEWTAKPAKISSSKSPAARSCGNCPVLRCQKLTKTKKLNPKRAIQDSRSAQAIANSFVAVDTGEGSLDLVDQALGVTRSGANHEQFCLRTAPGRPVHRSLAYLLEPNLRLTD